MVVPVEPVSLTIGIVALASLFSTCIECFDYFKAGQASDEYFELLLVKLDVEKTRLLIWGNAVGVLKPEGEGRSLELNSSQKMELVGRCLEKIKSLLSDTDKLEGLYGLRSSTDAETNSRKHTILSVNSMTTFKTSYRRFWGRFAGSQSRSTLLMRTRWAIHDKDKFEGLVHHLKDLIDGLNQVVLVKKETQDQIMHDDIISILDISKLSLIKNACEGSYTTLSRAASTVIAASEMGTIDRRNIEEWLGDANGINEDDAFDEVTDHKERKAVSHATETSTQAPLFTLISGRQGSQMPCQLSQIGRDSMEQAHCVLKPSLRSVGKRIADTLDPNRFAEIDLNELMNRSDNELTNHQRLALPVATIYIYCAPCACLLATAFDICKEAEADSRAATYYRFLVRPDDRLVSSCCIQDDRSLGLASVIDKIKTTDNVSWTNLKYIDILWVEQRLYDIEEEIDLPQPIYNVSEMGGKVFSSHHSEQKTAGIVILGELDYCLSIMRSPPFQLTSRMPKETEIFQIRQGSINGRNAWAPKFLGTYRSKADPIISQRAIKLSGAFVTAPVLPSSVSAAPFHLVTTPSTTTDTAEATPALSFSHQIPPPPSPVAKRQRTSVVDSNEVEITPM